MDWLTRMNDALTYIESNLDGEISVQHAAQLATCSTYHFTRMFSYVCGVPLSEYLRRRRLTQAALDLQRGDKVLAVALRYGYESPTAFNRAFRAVHGIPPGEARKSGTKLKAYPRLRFQLTVKGATEMDYRIVEKEAFRVVGIRTPIGATVEENAKIIMPFWQNARETGQLEPIVDLINGEPGGLLGVCVCEGGCCENGHYHICAVTDKPTPSGMHEIFIPKHTWAVFSGRGKADTIADLFNRIYTEWQPTSGYDWAATMDMEVYLDANPNDMRYEVWMPVKKA